MSLRALIFDVDGTLADTEEVHRRSFNRAFHEHGLDWEWDPRRYRELLKVTGGKERIGAFLATLDLTVQERDARYALIPELHRAKTAFYTRSIEQGQVALREGVARLFDEAQTSGIRLAIATTTSFANIEALLTSAFGPAALGRIAAIGSGDDVPRKKPAPDVYLAVLRQLNLPAGECVAFEDSANGLKSAQAAGLFTVVTPCFWTQGEDLGAADLLLSALGSAAAPLPGPEAARLGAPWLGLEQLAARLQDRHAPP